MCIAIALVLIIWNGFNRRIRWYLVAFFVIAAAQFSSGRCGSLNRYGRSFRCGSGSRFSWFPEW